MFFVDGFKKGHFDSYSKESLVESLRSFSFHDSLDYRASGKVPVFISHKHEDLPDLKGVIGFLEREYDCVCYIDSNDEMMPSRTNGNTAKRIKEKIRRSRKFILLATPGAINSKWCNWELGLSDGCKSTQRNIALLFINTEDNFSSYGNEYMQIYPHIVKMDPGSRDINGRPFETGHYVKYRKDNYWCYEELGAWINNNQRWNRFSNETIRFQR